MTRLSSYFRPTEREAPADAEAISHILMVRAGLVRQVGSGLWSWLPAGWRIHERVVQIVREEMNAIGGQEMLMPVLHPAEPWRRTGRYEIEELFKLKDRRGADLVLAMTHEEIVTGHVASAVQSYRELPLILYHFQVKERDEPRPRAGVLRTREVIVQALEVPAGATLKAFPIVTDDGTKLVMVRGDHRVNEVKLQNALGQPFRAARPDEVEQQVGPPGYIGPVGAQMPILLDRGV